MESDDEFPTEDETHTPATNEPTAVTLASDNDDDDSSSASASVEASAGDDSKHLVQTGSTSRGKVFSGDRERSSTLKALLGGRRTSRQTRKVDHDQRTLEAAHGYQTVNDIHVTVCNPQRVENYVLYVVKTKTTRNENGEMTEYTAKRRYTDFVWLREKLEAAFPAHLLPPMPEKQSLQRWVHYTPSFLAMRQRGLNKFLQRIASHPVLSSNESFFQFLTVSDEKLPELRKEAAGLLSRFSESLHVSVAAMMLKNPDAQFANTSEYIENLRKQLGEVRRIEQNVTEEQTELLASMKQLSMALQGWLMVDSDLAGILAKTTLSTDKQIQSLEASLADIEPSALQPLKEYYLYTDSVKQVLKRRDSIQMDYELVLDDLSKKEEELENARSAGQQDKVTALEERVKEVAEQVDRKSDAVDVANADLRAELDRWHSYKRMDMKEIFTDIADRQISYHQKSQEALKEVIQELETEDDDET